MANDIKINIITDYKQTSDALNKVTGGVGAYRKAIIAAGNDQEKLSKSRKDFANALAREGSQFEKYGESLESVKKIREMVAKELNYLTTGMGMEDETVKALTSTYQIYDDRLKKLNQSKEEESRKTKEAIALAEEHNLVMKQTLAELESMYEARKALNDKNAPIGFMVLEGDEIGVAKYALTEYRKTLEEIISATGINSKETEKAYQVYLKQSQVVDSLNARNREAIELAQANNNIQKVTLSNLESMIADMAQLNAKNANIGFMVLQGDEIGVAQHTLKEYEVILKETIAATGLNSEETKKAYEAYKKQEGIVTSLKEQELSYNNTLKEQEAILNRINSRYEEYEAKRYKTGPVDAGNGFSFDQSNMQFFSAIGDNVGYAREELKMYESQLRHVLASENASADAVKAATKAYKKQKQALAEIENAAKKSTIGISKFASVFVNIIKFQLVLKAMNGVRQLITESAQAAAEAEQVFNKLGTVFAGVETSARSMSAALASSIGVANSTAASALSTVGDLLQAQGMGTYTSLSTASDWVSQFQDIIAFKDLNMSLEEFAQNFMSGAAGNLRNFRTFGSIVKETAVNARLASKGLDQLTGSELELAKMTARAEIALEQQANAMGATEREWDTMLSVNRRYNEEVKRLKENLGSSLNQSLMPFKNSWTEILDTINKSIEAASRLKSLLPEDKQSTGGLLGIVHSITENFSSFFSGLFSNKTNFEYDLLKTLSDLNIKKGEDITSDQMKEIVSVGTDIYGLTRDELTGVLTKLGKLGITVTQVNNAFEAIVADKNFESMVIKWEDASSKADSLVTSLSSLMGVNMFGYDSAVSDYSTIGLPSSIEERDEWLELLAIDLNSAIQSAVSSITTKGWKAFADPLDNALGLSTESGGLENKYGVMKSLYEILRNSFIESDGYISKEEQTTLDSIVKKMIEVKDNLQAIADEVERQKKYSDGLSAMQSNTTSYANQMAQIGMTDNEKAIDNLRITYETLVATVGETEELKNAYDDQVASLKRLQAMQEAYNDELEKQSKIDSLNSTTADYGKQLRQLGMTDAQKTIDDLWAQITGDEELDFAINAQIEAFNKLTEATKAYEDELARQEAWQNLGQSALNSVGTVGSAINTMVNGDGDIWTRLLEVVLDIFQQSEHWSDVVDALNQVIQPILPLVEMIAYMLSSLQPVWDVIAFVLKVIASVVTMIQGAVSMVVDVIQWVWDNLKVALNNIEAFFYNLFHSKNKKEREDYKNILDYWEETSDKTNDVLYKIWHGVTDDKSFSYLDDLLRRDIITLDQYNAGLRVAQKDMVFDPVSPAQYVASGSAGGSTVQYGNVTLTINGGNVEETQRMVIRVMREAGYDIGNVPLYT